MTNEKSTGLISPTIDHSLDRAFVLPKRFIRHLRLFTDLDIRTYILLLGKFLPNHMGKISRKSMADSLAITEAIAKRSLLRLMAFGLIRMSPDVDPDMLRIELYSDPITAEFVQPTQTRNDWANRIAEAVGDKDNLPTYQYLVDTVSLDIIRKAITETLSVPTERISKSRPALFFALIRKYAAVTTNPGN